MSDDASPSSAARTHDRSQPIVNSNGVTWDEAPTTDHNISSQQRSRSRTRRRRRRKSRRRRNPGLAKKLEFVTHLLRSLDTLVFAELSALYYMEYASSWERLKAKDTDIS